MRVTLACCKVRDEGAWYSKPCGRQELLHSRIGLCSDIVSPAVNYLPPLDIVNKVGAEMLISWPSDVSPCINHVDRRVITRLHNCLPACKESCCYHLCRPGSTHVSLKVVRVSECWRSKYLRHVDFFPPDRPPASGNAIVSHRKDECHQV